MRRVLALAISTLAACGFEAGKTPAGDVDATPGTQPDASMQQPGDDDRDDDGIADESDNCPDLANADQFNEDGDARGDACDPCPQLGDAASDADGDGDGIGDGCDPNPGAGGDKLVYWNGFHTPADGLPSALAMIHGSATHWSIAGDSLVFTHSATDDWNIPAFDTGARAHTTDAEIEVVASFAGTAAAAGVAVDIASNDDDVFECQVRTDGDRRELWYWNGRTFGGWDPLAGVAATSPNATYRIVLKRTPGDLACNTIRDGATTALTSTRDSANRTRAGVFMRNVDAKIHYLAIYTSP